MTSAYIDSLPLTEQHLIRSVTRQLKGEFAGTFGPETVERFVADSLAELVPHAKVTSFYRCSPRGSLASASVHSPKSMASQTLDGRRCCSSASTTPAAHRWRPVGSATSLVTGSMFTRPAPNRHPRSIERPSRRWQRSASTSPRSFRNR